ncbi:kynureninase [Roseovarius sp. CAU 1744]|uniref:kynureninase n=1 Tax=Roseovarius sp. CAU 1744 TaxID=3140368 RepID=UPI00325A94FC
MIDFKRLKDDFHLPEGVTYLDGNSLGPLPKTAAARMAAVMQAEWGDMLITGWNRAGWMDQPRRLGDRIARLIGAEPGHVVLGDTLSIKVYQALAAALALRPDRKVILSDTGNFPSDLYMAEGLIRTLDRGHELRVVAPDKVSDHITDEVAATLLTEVDYRTGHLHNMAQLTEKAHNSGALAIWDLAHSAGAIPVDLQGCSADFAVGCTYKYLNGGPGAPAFIYVAPRYADRVDPALSGWLGHAAPFAFDPRYQPGPGIERMRVGTPPVLAMAALEAALDIWDRVEMDAVRARSIALSQRFIERVERACPTLTLASPRDPENRGSQVSFRFEHGFAAMQACIAQGVIGDFRAPDIMRFGITPLYLDEADIDRAAAVLAKVMAEKQWENAEFQQQGRVT